MFMYAAGLSAATRLNTELKLGMWGLKAVKADRQYQLSCFPAITEKAASWKDLLRLCPGQLLTNLFLYKPVRRRHIFRRAALKFLRLLSIDTCERRLPSREKRPFPYLSRFQRVYFTPNDYHEFHRIVDDTILLGFWANAGYFENVEGLLRKKFTFSQECFDEELLHKVITCNSVALHVRRGDKVNNKSFKPSTIPYLKASLEKISSLTHKPVFFVFSDGMDWCKETLPKLSDAEFHFIEGHTPPQDMAIMTKCKHVIVAPSHFSWWGAWLNDNPGKIIITPYSDTEAFSRTAENTQVFYCPID